MGISGASRGGAEARSGGAELGAAEPIPGVIGLRVPGAIAYRHLAIRLVTTACKMALDTDPSLAGDGGDFENEVVSAFGEAFNNIAVHGFEGLPPGPVQIEVGWDDEKLVITCVDSGHSFDPDAVAPPALDELPEHGMGLFIMRSCMDEVLYQAGPPNVLRMIKRRAHAGILPVEPRDAVTMGTSGTPKDEPEEGGGRGSGVDIIPTHENCAGGARGRTAGGDDRKIESSRRR